jgi:hypothetical protein
MKSFFKLREKNSEKPRKLAIVFLLVFMSFSFLFIHPQPVQAQAFFTDPIAATWNGIKWVADQAWKGIDAAWKKGGSIALQQTLRTVLNKIAVDTANYVGTGLQGQKPLFITNPGSYALNALDEAGGTFLENFANNLTVSGGCDDRKKECNDDCDRRIVTEGISVAESTACSVECNGVCGTAADKKTLCLRNCQTSYLDKAGKDLSKSTLALRNERTSCEAVCNSTKYTDGSLATNGPTTNSLATPSFNACSPSSMDAQLKITLGLAEQRRPQGPDCKASDILKNWTELDNYGNTVAALKDVYESVKTGSWDDQVYLNDIKGIFSPGGNDFAIYLSAKSDLATEQANAKLKAEQVLVGKGGWLDSLNIAGKTKGLPNQAQISSEASYKAYTDNLGKFTGDAFVDALNTFLSQVAYTGFNTLMQKLGETSTAGSGDSGAGLSDKYNGPNNTGGQAVTNEITKFNKPNFSSANYDILSLLSICPSQSDDSKMGPTDCVIDSSFMQAIAEQKTVAEAISAKLLNSGWKLTTNNKVSTAYTLRNVSILRKYRILPVGWEVAIQKVSEKNINDATLGDLISCFADNDSYENFISQAISKDQDWCRGLVDPNWVLKAPLNYCGKEGIGGQLLTSSITPAQKGLNGQPDILSKYSVSRVDTYCADVQTCIQENSNGTCDAYGYCNEERRTWNFGADSCKPVNNTCQTFTGGVDSKTVSYLENTLDYSNCSEKNSGCRQYSLTGNYSEATSKVVWNPAKSLYFNASDKFTSCDQNSEGCTGLMRVRSANGTNLVINSDFSADKLGDTNAQGSALNAWPISGAGSSWKATIAGPDGSKALKLEANGSSGARIAVYSDANNSILPKNLQVIPGQAYTLSAQVYLESGPLVEASIGAGSNRVYNRITETGSWQKISVTRSPDNSFNTFDFSIGASGPSGVVFYVKDIKFEAKSYSSNYSVYGAAKIYEKLLPNYLENTCYVDALNSNYNLKNTPPGVCGNFARKCNKEEVGCEKYTAANDFSVAAKVNSSDSCPESCLGYDVYIARLTPFNSAQKENLIPTTAQKCNAEEVGCNEFTNLDSLGQGGETREYYSELKQCIKPSTDQCASFYAWEGAESGYQLKSYSLKKNTEGALIGDPATTSDDSSQCNSDIYHADINSASYNPDCLEFYNAAGKISYHLLAKTITCSDDCHNYRLSDKNIDSSITSSAECSSSNGDRYWDNVNNTCLVCLNGGTYDNAQKACIYKAIPSEGRTCQASAKDCREYSGSNGENIRSISVSDFENSSSDWSSNCNNGVAISTIANTNNGHSLKINSGASSCQEIGNEALTPVARQPLIKQILAADNSVAQLLVGQDVQQGLSYNISFLARATDVTNLKIYFYNKETKQASYFNSASGFNISGGNEWQIYRANLESLEHPVSDNEVLVIEANKDIYLDSFSLDEVSERYYLIKKSSQVPVDCFYDNFGAYQGTDYNLGCRQYTDRAGTKINLRQFSELCSDSGVGCEQMIDTKNYSPGGKGIWGDSNNNKKCDSGEPDCFEVSADTAIYAVYDQNKQCNVADLGCSRLGLGSKIGTASVWTDVFKRNNPDNYTSILCSQSDAGCEKWSGNSVNAVYFKDPGDNTCVFRAPQGVGDKAWFKSPVKRCDVNKDGKIAVGESNNVICSSDTDCSGSTCIIDSNDYPCHFSNSKTFGLGGQGNQIAVPDEAVALCEANEAGCTEYIDPLSTFVSNLVANPSFVNIGGTKEGWDSNSEQVVKLEAYKLYIFNVEGDVKNDTYLNFSNDVKLLGNNNQLAASTKELVIRSQARQSQMFYSLNNTQATISSPQENKIIIVKPAVVDYQLKNNIEEITKGGACGVNVNFDQGCILFNERSVNGKTGYANLNVDAYKTNGSAQVQCTAGGPEGSCNANKLVKVKPDRTCSKWLSGTTYTKVTNKTTGQEDIIYYSVADCNRLSDDGRACANFVNNSSSANKIFNPDIDKNSTGYSMMDKYPFSEMKEVGLTSDFHEDFESGSTQYAVYRKSLGATTSPIINEPQKGFPQAHGRGLLKVEPDKIAQLKATNLNVAGIYYLNFLVYTPNSEAKVTIKYEDGATIKTLETLSQGIDYRAAGGFERKILSFETIKGIKEYTIELSTKYDSQPAVYFDDLNIEPVLRTAGSEYISRECRLYPEISSLTCSDSAIRDGLEGYCLEHDLRNPAVCSLWYPVDHINAALTGRGTKGYTGTAPLSYCTQVNGNFELVEKRQIYKPGDRGINTDKGMPTEQQFSSRDYYSFRDCNKGMADYNSTGNSQPPIKGFYTPGAGFPMDTWCGSDYILFSYYYPYFGPAEGITADETRCRADYWCIPKKSGGMTVKIKGAVGQTGGKFGYFDETYIYNINDDKYTIVVPTGNDSSEGYQVSDVSYTKNWPDDPIPGSGTIKSTITVSGVNGWYKYNGIGDDNFVQTTTSDSWVRYNANLTTNSPVRVFDYTDPGKGIQLINATGGADAFRLACDSFTEVVSKGGVNKAWSNRISSTTMVTPNYFLIYKGQLPFYYKEQLPVYNNRLVGTPFGSAIIPADTSLSGVKIKLKSIFSNIGSNKQVAFAGRPYGCSGNNCNIIGSCSDDNDIFCLVPENGETDSIKNSLDQCVGKGKCFALWTPPLSSATSNGNIKPDYENILKTIFLDSYSSSIYTDGAYKSSSTVAYKYSDSLPECEAKNLYSDGKRIDASSFCAVYPIVNNVILKIGGKVISPSSNTADGTTYNITKTGVYELNFNIKIDQEQQPLNNINIQWGKEAIQTITGQDNQVESSNPHIVFHYFNSTGNQTIKIRATDNWGKFNASQK